MQKNKAVRIMFAVVTGATLQTFAPTLWSAELNTKLPAEQEDQFSVPITMDMPAQSLGAALRQFSLQANLSLTVDSTCLLYTSRCV